MIIQVANIVSGFALAAPKLAEFGGKEHIEKAHGGMLPYLKTIGIVELILGILALLDRMGIFNMHVMNFGSSYPQAIPGVLMGLVLASSVFTQYEGVANLIKKIEPHKVTLGLVGIAVGLGSILFGCILCGYWYTY